MKATYAERGTRQCAECGFWLLGRSGPCVNCGRRFPTLDPASRLQDMLVSLALATLVGVGLLLLAGPFSTAAPGWTRASTWLGSSLAAGCGLSALALRFLRSAHRKGSLCELERDIRARLQDLDRRQEQIDRLGRHLLDGQGSARHAEAAELAGRLLAEGRRVLQEHRGRYEEEMLKLRILRWRNRLGSILAVVRGESRPAGERKLHALHSILSEGIGLLQASQEQGRESSAFVQLRADLSSCRLLFEGLLNQQIVEAVRGLSPLESARVLISDSRIDEADGIASRLDQSLSAESFRESLEQLRYELDRMEAERSLAR